jgi:hypothetical protein
MCQPWLKRRSTEYGPDHSRESADAYAFPMWADKLYRGTHRGKPLFRGKKISLSSEATWAAYVIAIHSSDVVARC